jgi:hypothetical protein
MSLLNRCSSADKSFKENLPEADNLTDYAVEIRYPDDWYEPTIEETKLAYPISYRQAHNLNWIEVIQAFLR